MSNSSDILNYSRLQLLTIEKVINHIDWYILSTKYKLSEDFIRNYRSKVDWESVSIYQILSEDFIKEFYYYLNWYNISTYQTLSEEFIRANKNKVNWQQISAYQILTEDFMIEFQDKLDWQNISMYQIFSEEFIEKYIYNCTYYLSWIDISSNQTLSEKFIIKYKDYVFWPYISRYQTLSEETILKLKDYVYWPHILKYQNLSKEFKVNYSYSNSITKKLRLKVFEKYGGLCGYSGTPLTADWQIDHIIPRRYFKFNPNEIHKMNHIDNLMPTQRIINNYKRGYSLKKFKNLLSTLHIRISKLPKNPRTAKSIKHKEYMLELANYFNIEPNKPFNNNLYYEKIQKKLI